MQVLTDSNNNKIYGDLSLQRNLKFDFKGKNNILFLAGVSTNVNVTFYGDNGLLFHAGGGWSNGSFSIITNGLCYVGCNSTTNGVTYRACEGKSIIIGDDCMFSWSIWLLTCDHHLIFDENSYKRINHSKSIFVGDHVWIAQEVGVLKGSLVGSGSVLGAKSINAGLKFSNAIYAGNPSRYLKKDIFWSREDPIAQRWDKDKTAQFSSMHKDDFKFDFEKDKFLNPSLLDKRLDELESAYEKLEFVYDYIYNNTHKNRFALFEDSDISKCELYKDESKTPFKELKFEMLKPKPAAKPAIKEPAKINGAVLRVKNQLSYKLGSAMISNSKSLKGYFKLPFILYQISKEHKFEAKVQEINIKQGLIPQPLRLEEFKDYKEALKFKEHLSYKLGSALIKACNNAWGGGVAQVRIYRCA
ncbi:hypothetical protein DMB92_08060 [Campylobacter sp. MIT 99-7217]|uniref:hypothetical protein n=1 Tax=Campylobacter sp. MIT 99-7217 TaxID=535091 RepID=UPI00115A89F0|nr:hypothetical protein [Campylobacter sp. MIT 99-7217]TQR29549.1 hypothetical protein DMB92_08060 [Campylobacter sp. MIT 99-7217]